MTTFMTGRRDRFEAGALARGFVRTCAAVFALAIPCRVLAGPIELFASVETASDKPDRVVARWINGDGGIFVSNDNARTFGMTCFTAASPELMGRSVQAFKTAPDGSQCVGTVSQTFCSAPSGCGWKEATELNGQWISDFAEDPVDKKRLYLATGTSTGDNGVWVREEPGAQWKPMGTQMKAWFSRLFVVPLPEGKRRFYASSQETVTVPSMDGGAPTQAPKYFIRYSDDDGKTWTSNPYGDVPDRTNLRLVGVDPTNPDRILVLLMRTGEGLTDDLFFSDKRGEAGSYTKIGSVTAFSNATFLPDGTLWYGDNDQMTPGLYKVAKLGDAPEKVSDAYKVGCVNYDARSDRLYICADWRLGTADRTTGEFTTLFDIRKAESFLECAGEGPLNERCGPALKSPNFCDITHYPDSPVCVKYFGTHGPDGGTAGAAGGSDGATAGAGGMSIAAGAGGASGAAGSGEGGEGRESDAGEGPKAGAKDEDSGCSCRAVGSRHTPAGAWLGLGLAFAFVARRRRRPRAAARGS
jgi:MYXO-CTERM domain-containing protein